MSISWTADRPTVQGFYWRKSPKFWTPAVVDVFEADGRLAFSSAGNDEEFPLGFEGPDVRWAGPLVPPADDSGVKQS